MQFEYGPDQRVPLIKSVLFGLQWAAILISSIIILGKVIGGIQFTDPYNQIVYLQKLLFLSAVTLFCQIFWGHRLPLVPGPAAVLLIGVLASQGFGMPTIYSSIALGGFFIAAVAISGLFRYLQQLFTPNVVVVVLLLIAFTLAPTIQNLMIDSKGGIPPLYNLGFALVLIFTMFLFYRLLRGIWKSTLIIWAMAAGSLFYFIIFPKALTGVLLSGPFRFSGFFRDMNLSLSIQPGVLISFIVCFIALSINDLGSIQSVNELVKPDDEGKRVARGITLTGLANIASGFFGIIGPVNYSLSPGVIMSTGCASRFPLIYASIVMLLLAFFPSATGFMGSVPSVVIGAVLSYVMTAQVSAGLTVAYKQGKEGGFRFDDGLVIGLSIFLGTVVAFLPVYVLKTIPSFLQPILGNGFVVGVVSALLLEHIVLGVHKEGEKKNMLQPERSLRRNNESQGQKTG
jgi:xanthine/uracil permease